MLDKSDYRLVRDLLLQMVSCVQTQNVPLEECGGRVLAQDVTAREDVPSFRRSPYDGFAFRSRDVAAASDDDPVSLRLVDYIAAGDISRVPVTEGTAVHLMTGAPVPEGADAVLPFEKTVFTEETVTVREAPKPGTNVIEIGEDVKKGTLLCTRGSMVDAGAAGTLAGQGIFAPLVYRRPLVGIISTGSELLPEGQKPVAGRIYNTNRYSLQAACAQAGCLSKYVGTASDRPEEISRLIRDAAEKCDVVLLSGGVSVGDYDCTPAAMELAEVQILARGLALKPGMAGAYGMAGDIPVLALSGNPAACMTAFYAVALPVLYKRMGRVPVLPGIVRVRAPRDYVKRIPADRLLRARIDLSAAVQEIEIPSGQGNQMLSTLTGCNAFAVVPAGTMVEKGGEMEAFLI